MNTRKRKGASLAGYIRNEHVNNFATHLYLLLKTLRNLIITLQARTNLPFFPPMATLVLFCQLRCEQKLSILPEEQKKNIVASFSISWQLVPYCLPHTVLSFFSLVKTVKLQAWKAARR